MHAFALVAAAAVEIAGKSGKFWEFHDRLFQESDKLSNEKILDIAVELGFDRAGFERQLKDPDILNRIQADIVEGTRVGVQGVPMVFVNGRHLKERTPEGFQRMINSELQKRSKSTNP